MNYIEAFKKQFDRFPTEKEIAILMEAVAKQEGENQKNKSIIHRPTSFVARKD